jgi:hypothetical protein
VEEDEEEEDMGEANGLVNAPSLVAVNVRGLSAEVAQFIIDRPPNQKADIYCITECWSVHDSVVRALQQAGFDTFYRARHTGQQGGGVMILVRRTAYCSRQLPSPPVGDVAEVLMVEVVDKRAGSCLTNVAAIYAPPNCNKTALDIAVVMSSLARAGAHVVAGDFNARHLSWDPAPIPAGGGRDFSFMRGNNLAMWCAENGWHGAHECMANPIPSTTSGTCIDLILMAPTVAPSGWFSITGVDTATKKMDHYAMMLMTLPSGCLPPARRVRPILWHKVDEKQLGKARSSIRRLKPTMLNVARFLKTLACSLPRGALKPVAPIKVTADRVMALREKMDSIKTDADAWRMLNSTRSSPPPSTPLTETGAGGVTVVWKTSRQRARALMRTFAAKHTTTRDFPVAPRPVGVLDGPPITAWDVKHALSRLKRNTSPDSNSIDARLLLALKDDLAPLLAVALTDILQGRTNLPEEWRFSTFIPLLKTDKPSDRIDSYRPVAITSLLCRVCERVVAQRILGSVESRLAGNQFGFRPGRSTVDALAAVVDAALNGFALEGNIRRAKGIYRERRHETLVGLFDLSDAFSKVPHVEVMMAMRRLEVPHYLQDFVWRWLQRRKGCVFHEGVRSRTFDLPAGVPQGSVLGPLLFVLYIDDLLKLLQQRLPRFAVGRSIISIDAVAYADDLTVWVTGLQEEHMGAAMRLACNTVIDPWCREHGMLLSGKTQFVILAPNLVAMTPEHEAMFGTFTLCGTQFVPTGRPAKTPKLLGVYLDCNLSWWDHTSMVAERMRRDITELAVVAPFIPPALATTIWSSSVMTALYASEIWAGRAGERAWMKLETLHGFGVRTANRMVKTCGRNDAIFNAGMLPLRATARVKALRSSAKKSAFPEAKDAPIFKGHFADAIRHTNVLRRMEPPAVLSSTVDRISFLVEPPIPIRKKMATEAECRKSNEFQRQLALAYVPPGNYVLEGACDATVVEKPKHQQGGATIVYDPPAAPNCVVEDALAGSVEYNGAPENSCSYTAEAHTGTVLLDRMLVRAREWRRGHPDDRLSALVFGDCKSWISQAATSPLQAGPIAPPIWRGLMPLAEECETVTVAHVFSHCGDPKNEVIDEAADACLAQSNPPASTTPWHVDVSRPSINLVRGEVAKALRQKGGYHSFSTFMEKNYPHDPKDPAATGRVPPRELRRNVAVDIQRLRTGAWRRLGPGAILYGVAGTPCRFCATPLVVTHGQAVEHLFSCTSHPPPAGITIQGLWSKKVEVLKAVWKHCNEFTLAPGAREANDDDATLAGVAAVEGQQQLDDDDD